MIRTWTSLVILILSNLALGQSSNSFEQKMHNIYKQSYSQEVSDERWASYLTGVGNRTYSVRPGDTLWDLSVVFFGDGLFWSKIWSYNERLTNPHLLSVGQNIRFFAGSVEQAPGVEVDPVGNMEAPGVETTPPPLAEGESIEAPPTVPSNLPEGFKEVKVAPVEEVTEEVVTTTAGDAEVDIGEETLESVDQVLTPNQPVVTRRVRPSRLYPGAPAIPPPSRLMKPVLKQLPNTFSDSDTYDASQYDEKGISFDIRPPVRVNPLFVAHQFLYASNARNYPRVGKVLESENKTKLVGLNQQLYVEADQSFDIGERLTVMGQDYPFDRNGIIGDVIEYQGTIEITEKVKEKIYRGVIIKSLDGIKGSPWLSREVVPTFTDDYVGRPNNKKLRIIGGGKDNVTRFYGQSDVVFLKGGAKEGVRVGDIMGVYKRRDIRYGDTVVDKAPVPIGHIKVFRAEPNLSSAFVISSDDVIVPGDETGVPTLVEAVTTQSEKADLDSIETGLDFQTDPAPDAGGTLEEDLEFDFQ